MQVPGKMVLLWARTPPNWGCQGLRCQAKPWSSAELREPSGVPTVGDVGAGPWEWGVRLWFASQGLGLLGCPPRPLRESGVKVCTGQAGVLSGACSAAP